MKCSACGSELRRQSRFCPACGAKQTEAPALPSTTETHALGKYRTEAPEPQEKFYATSIPPAVKSGRKMAKRGRAVVAATMALILAISGIGVYLIWFRGREEGLKTREYQVTVLLPPRVSIDLSRTRLLYGSGYEASLQPQGDSSASAKVKMHDQSTGLLVMQDPDSQRDLLYAVFPKDSRYLADYVPEVSAMSTAQTLVFLQQGIAVSNPVTARILLEVIKSLPET